MEAKKVRALQDISQLAGNSFTLRLELFGDVSNPERFRAHLWRLESYRIQPTFPQDEATGQPAHEFSDETIWVDTALWLSQDYADFQAPTAEEAIQIVLNDFRAFLAQVLGE